VNEQHDAAHQVPGRPARVGETTWPEVRAALEARWGGTRLGDELLSFDAKVDDERFRTMLASHQVLPPFEFVEVSTNIIHIGDADLVAVLAQAGPLLTARVGYMGGSAGPDTPEPLRVSGGLITLGNTYALGLLHVGQLDVFLGHVLLIALAAEGVQSALTTGAGPTHNWTGQAVEMRWARLSAFVREASSWSILRELEDGFFLAVDGDEGPHHTLLLRNAPTPGYEYLLVQVQLGMADTIDPWIAAQSSADLESQGGLSSQAGVAGIRESLLLTGATPRTLEAAVRRVVAAADEYRRRVRNRRTPV